MNKFTELMTLLENQKHDFLCFEQETMRILACDPDEIDTHMKLREELRMEIDEINQKITALCEGEDAAFLQAAHSSSERATLTPQLQEIFDCSMEIRSIVYRIQTIEPQALHRLTDERDAAMDKIKELNQGASAAAAKYYKTTHTQAGMEFSRGKI